MKLTLAEAERMECPTTILNQPFCQGYQCMAWRWADKITAEKARKLLTHEDKKNLIGYCGLVGKTEDDS